MEVIRNFLEEVVQVVPLESILYAIATGSYNVVLSCSKALAACDLDLPPSSLMMNGFKVAMPRLWCGIPPQLALVAESEARKQLPQWTSMISTFKQEKSGKMIYAIFPRIPGVLGQMPFSPPLAQLKFSREELEFVDNPEIKKMGECLQMIYDSLLAQVEHQDRNQSSKVVSGLNIELLCPIHSKSSQRSDVTLKSPLDISAEEVASAWN